MNVYYICTNIRTSQCIGELYAEMDNGKLYVKGVSGSSPDDLARRINRWISENDYELVDVKYSSAAAAKGTGFVVVDYSALVIYKEP